MSRVKDLKLSKSGEGKVYWAEGRMPVLMKIRERFAKEKPLKGITIGACLHVTKETAVLVETLRAGGAKVALCASNPLSTQDDVAAYLADKGIETFAWRGQNNDEYYECIRGVADFSPQIVIDDGADLTFYVHEKKKELLPKMIGGCEETTTGVMRLRAMAEDKALKYPVIDINGAQTKNMFDNRYGTGQSAIDGILRATNVLLAGKNFVVAGYGWCGKGVARRAQGMGANVIVCEVDPVKALEALMDGYRVMATVEAAKIGDIFLTVTGCRDVFTGKHFALMRDGAILSNAGHFNIEVSVADLEKLATGKKQVRENVVEYAMKNRNKLYLLGEGRLVNLACAEGHPSEVMDMSFANQALSAEYLVKNRLAVGVHNVPAEIDREVARLKLASMGAGLEGLTAEQKKYLSSWKEGT